MLNFIWILSVRNQEKPSKQEKNNNTERKTRFKAGSGKRIGAVIVKLIGVQVAILLFTWVRLMDHKHTAI